ncbi:MAG TPA: aminotransferase class III-fold pyridoxal phosphate-dependent enzyme [Streptosporangiaceae bacterium]|jgi:glutamate-1-semialdehyde 2,1-aminomutase
MSNDATLRKRAAAALPNGVYGHMLVNALGDPYPQFIAKADGVRLTDVDGREYVDVMCAYGPMLLGYGHPGVRAAARAQEDLGDCVTGTPPVMVELAELFVDTVAAADWAMFAKNGTDATTTCVTIARAATGKKKVLVARGSYHGAAPWCVSRGEGVTPEDQAHLVFFEYNDLASVRAAVDEAGDDLAAVLVTPFRHDLKREQELADPEFAKGLREICDRTGAALILDDVRCGFRLDLAGSWEPLGVRPDLSAWSKAIANGYALAAVTGTDALREAVARVFVTGSFWYSAVSMAAAKATLTELRETDAIARVERAGTRLRTGLAAQAESHDFLITQSGPVQMPLLTFADDPDFTVGRRWAQECARRGVYVHPWHNWFLSAAHTDAEIDLALSRTEDAFAALRA